MKIFSLHYQGELNGKKSFLSVLLMSNGKRETVFFVRKLILIYIYTGGLLFLLRGKKVP